MRVLPYSAEALKEAVTILQNGGVIAHATETCYGLACNLSNEKAVEKVFAIKHRSHSQPISGLFASVVDAKQYVEWNARAEELSAKLPGPLTLILPLRPDAPLRLFPKPKTKNEKPTNVTIGIRVSSHPHAAALVEAFESPISTTSANIHGKENPYSAEDIVKQFEGQDITPDLILDSGQLPQVPPSTVMDLTTDDEKILRS